MPAYDYKCNKCEKQFEVIQKMADDVLKIHDEKADPDFDNCLGDLVKLFSTPGIVWKGSGFYKTDSRTGSKSSAKKDKPEKKEAPKSDKKPAKPSDSK